MTTFLDTSIIIALLDEADTHHGWSKNEFDRCKEQGPAIISDIVYCEMSVGMESKEKVDKTIASLGLERVAYNDAALFRAGEAYKECSQTKKGQKLGVFPDFLIGAAAEVNSAPLMTVNSRDFVRYFPKMKVIVPRKKS